MAKESFGNWFRKACNTAGVKASAHGLRKLAAVRLAEDGVTAPQLCAVFGWKSIRMAEPYIRTANRRTLATQAMQKGKR
jgi:integrase